MEINLNLFRNDRNISGQNYVKTNTDSSIFDAWEAYLESCQTSAVEPLAIFAKNSIKCLI